MPQPRPDYPRPRLQRECWVNLNGEWEFGAGSARRFDLPAGFAYRGEPVIISEFGGVRLAGDGGLGLRRGRRAGRAGGGLSKPVEALLGPGPVEGFCYTQLTDVEQERNGLLGFDRKPKADPELLRSATATPKRR